MMAEGPEAMATSSAATASLGSTKPGSSPPGADASDRDLGPRLLLELLPRDGPNWMREPAEILACRDFGREQVGGIAGVQS